MSLNGIFSMVLLSKFLLARKAVLSAISLPLIPTWESIHIDLIFFCVSFSSVWINWAILFLEDGFFSTVKTLRESLIINMLFDWSEFANLITSSIA